MTPRSPIRSFAMLTFSKLPATHPFITFRVSRRRREMYCGHPRLCVCLSVRSRVPAQLHGPGCNFGSGRGCPLVVHCWADLQSGHGLRCYGNITRTRNVSEYMLVLALYAWLHKLNEPAFISQLQSIIAVWPAPKHQIILLGN